MRAANNEYSRLQNKFLEFRLLSLRRFLYRARRANLKKRLRSRFLFFQHSVLLETVLTEPRTRFFEQSARFISTLLCIDTTVSTCKPVLF